MLSAGARIALVAPSGVFDPDRLARGVALVESWGLSVVPGAHLYERHRFTAGSAAERTTDLSWALTDPDIDAVWFARGGYGTVQTLPRLPWDSMDGRPVIGFSDATALFAAMASRGVGGGIHGPVLHSLADLADEESQDAMRALLAGGDVQLPGTSMIPGPVVQGPVVGGNLCVLASLAGTPWALRAEGCIVVLEEIAEAPYKVDRLIQQLIDSGGLEGAVGLAIGEFRDCDAPVEADWTIRNVIEDKLAPLGLPVVEGLPVGHGPSNRPWRVGEVGTLGADGLGQSRVD
jgi:muramoyltetrapeptide carboxypeptidase